MGRIGKDFKYKIIKSFLSEDERHLLGVYCEIKHKLNMENFDTTQSNADTFFYGDPIMESLLLKKEKFVSELTGKKLLPTYSFWRAYTKFADLKKHSDRPSCEISTTVNISSDETSWPIFMDGTAIELKPGDAAVYLGCEVQHWRETFKGDYNMQVFLHYVDAEGDNKNYYMDQRKFWGIKN
jgi:hypothetical protein